MRWLMWLCLIFPITLNAQTTVPGFKSERVDSIYIDQKLIGTPREYAIEYFEYDKENAELIATGFENTYYLENGKVLAVEVTKNKRPYQFYQFDENGRIIEHQAFGTETNQPVVSYAYDDVNLKATEVVFRKDRTIHSKTVLTYDPQLNLIQRSEFTGNDHLARYWKYYYNASNDLTSDIYFDSPSKESILSDTPTDSTYYEYAYDQLKRVKNRFAYANTGLKERITYEYYPDSLVEKRMFYRFNGKANEQHIFIDNDSLQVKFKGYYFAGDTSKYRSRFREIYLNGDLVEYESRSMRGTKVDRFATFYELDEVGNWIQKLTYANGVILKKEVRNILY